MERKYESTRAPEERKGECLERRTIHRYMQLRELGSRHFMQLAAISPAFLSIILFKLDLIFHDSSIGMKIMLVTEYPAMPNGSRCCSLRPCTSHSVPSLTPTLVGIAAVIHDILILLLLSSHQWLMVAGLRKLLLRASMGVSSCSRFPRVTIHASGCCNERQSDVAGKKAYIPPPPQRRVSSLILLVGGRDASSLHV